MNERDAVRLRRTEAFLALLRYTRGQIDCYGLSAPRILARCAPELLSACGLPAGAVPDSFEAFLAACGKEDGLSFEILKGFAEEFGRQYRQEQLAECDRCIGLLEERRDVMRKELPNRRRLHVTLCLSGAALAVILLL